MPRPWRIACYHAGSATTSGSRNLHASRGAGSTTQSAPLRPGMHASSGAPHSEAPTPAQEHSTAGRVAGQVRILRTCPGTNQHSLRRPPNVPADCSAQSAQRTPKNEKTAASKGEARLIDPCKASARRRPAHGDGLRRPTGESPHRSSRHHGAASMPLDTPGRHRSHHAARRAAAPIHPQTTRSPAF